MELKEENAKSKKLFLSDVAKNGIKKVTEEPDNSVIAKRHSERKDAEAIDNERKNRIWETVEKLKEIEKQEKEDDEKSREFIKMVIDKTSAAQRRNYEDTKNKEENKIKNKRYEESTSKILDKTNKKQEKKVVKKEDKKRVSGTSLGDLLNSQEFRDMYNNTKEDDRTR